MKCQGKVLPKHFLFKFHATWTIRKRMYLFLLMFFPLLILLAFSQRCQAQMVGQNVQGKVEKLIFHRNKPVIKGLINNKEVYLLIDTGSSHSILDKKMARELGYTVRPSVTPSRATVMGITGNLIEAGRAYHIKCELLGQVIKCEFLCLDMHLVMRSLGIIKGKPIVGMIGTEALHKYGFVLDFGNRTIQLPPKGKKIKDPFIFTSYLID